MPGIKLTVAIELDTKDITGKCDFPGNLREWINQLELVEPGTVELILCSSSEEDPVQDLSCSVPMRKLQLPGTHYYGLKNAGASAAKGDVILFSDSDCRPGPCFIKTLLKFFEDPGLKFVCGRTSYDGSGVLARMNTSISFGFTHQESEMEPKFSPLTHNIALRRTLYERDPFGPFNGRVGGDEYLASQLRRIGCPMVPTPHLIIYHEDLGLSIRGTFERHLREHFAVLSRGWKGVRPSTWHVLRQVLVSPIWRFRAIRRWGPAAGVRKSDWPAILLILGLYAALDLIAVLVVLAVPRFKKRWYEYLFGQPLASEL